MTIDSLPLWIVWCPSLGEETQQDGKHFRAFTAKDAAEEWGRQHEWYGNEYTLEEEPETVKVCLNSDFGNVQVFNVRARTTREYYADPVKVENSSTEADNV